MDRRAFLAGSLAAVAAAPGIAVAQAGWVLLGTRNINWGMSRDTFVVTRNRDPVQAISFRTRGGEVFITDVEVFFVGGGRPERIPTRSRIRPNSRSNSIRLRTTDRAISRVDFHYNKRFWGRRASTALELHGRLA
jgi:hypothetical protein